MVTTARSRTVRRSSVDLESSLRSIIEQNDGPPLTTKDLSNVTGKPVPLVNRALTKLSSTRGGLIKVVEEDGVIGYRAKNTPLKRGPVSGEPALNRSVGDMRADAKNDVDDINEKSSIEQAVINALQESDGKTVRSELIDTIADISEDDFDRTIEEMKDRGTLDVQDLLDFDDQIITLKAPAADYKEIADEAQIKPSPQAATHEDVVQPKRSNDSAKSVSSAELGSIYEESVDSLNNQLKSIRQDYEKLTKENSELKQVVESLHQKNLQWEEVAKNASKVLQSALSANKLDS